MSAKPSFNDDNASILSRRGGQPVNEDYAAYKVSGGFACFTVGDGLGGQGRGEIAAKLAVNAVLEVFMQEPGISPSLFRRYFEAAQTAVLHGQQATPGGSRMSTTLAVVVTDSRSFVFGYVGDTRLYHFSGARIRLTTQDHSVPCALAKAGRISFKDIRFHEDRNRLLKVVGTTETFRPSIAADLLPVVPGDALLLCTDGFWEYVLEEEMEEDLAASPDVNRWLTRMEARLQQKAASDCDNYTALAVMFND